MSGCKTNADGAVTSAASASSSNSSGLIGTPGVVNNTGFFVQPIFAGPNKIQFYFHDQIADPLSKAFTCNVPSGTPSAGIAPGVPSTSDLVCILDVAELDLYANNLTFNFNSPVGMCPYTEVSPFVFYADMPGQVSSTSGPAVLNYTNTSGAINTGTLVVEGVNACAPTTFLGGVGHLGDVVVPVGANGQPECGAAATNGADGSRINSSVGLDATVFTPVCLYDYTKDPLAPGPNCCAGNFTTESTSTVAPFATVGTPGAFGGVTSACLSGPALDTQAKDGSGNPKNSLFYTFTNGTNQNYAISSPISKSAISVIGVANYWEPCDVTQTACGAGGNPRQTAIGQVAFPPNDGTNFCFGFPATGNVPDYNGCGGVSAVPLPMNNNLVTLSNGTTVANRKVRTNVGSHAAPSFQNVVFPGYTQTNAQPFYQFGCKDAAGDYIARIRILIRAWDTVAGFTVAVNPYNVPNPIIGNYTDTFGGLWHGENVWRDVVNAWWQFSIPGGNGTPSGTIPPLAADLGTGYARLSAGGSGSYVGPPGAAFGGKFTEPLFPPTVYPHFGNF